MLAALWLSGFLLFGLFAAWRMLPSRSVGVRAWAGLAIGMLGAMWAPTLMSFALGFGVLSHMLALIAPLAGCAWLYFRKRPVAVEIADRAQWRRDDHAMLLAILPLLAICALILYTHNFRVAPDGSWHVGQSTYGDLCLHAGIATGLSEQGIFPPEYTIFPGQRLSYPFLADSLSGSLRLLGMSLQLSLVLPALIMCALCFAGLYWLSRALRCGRGAALLSVVLFFVNGGLGLIYFLDNLKENPENFLRIFTGFYQTPTNLVENNVRWVNTLCDMMIPQRTLLFGWALLLFALWLLWQGIDRRDRRYMLCAGVVAGLMPMVHTHSFLALGVIAAGAMAASFSWHADKKRWFIDWLYFGSAALVLALPQLAFWTFPQTRGEGFLRLQFNWANDGDPWLWFWLKNVGVVFLFFIPALMRFGGRRKALLIGALVLFALAEIVVFQPNEYDNNKLFYVWYMLACIAVADYLIYLYRKLAGVPGRKFLAACLLLLATASGVLTIVREVKSDYEIFTAQEVRLAQFVRENTDTDALFLTAQQHNNAVATLAGRNVYCGTAVYLYFHGIQYETREQWARAFYRDIELMLEHGPRIGIDYLLVSAHERRLMPEEQLLLLEERLEPVYLEGDVALYALSPRAKAAHGVQ